MDISWWLLLYIVALDESTLVEPVVVTVLVVSIDCPEVSSTTLFHNSKSISVVIGDGSCSSGLLTRRKIVNRYN